jgi:hypothetical protein
MKKDELLVEHTDESVRRRYSQQTGQFIESEENNEFERTREVGRGRSLEEDRLLRDEDDAKTELPR